MQGSKKHADGLSDSSSIGSLLDDTDREVCSLTDRAFKSLCVAELEAANNELEMVISPDITYQFASKIHQGTLNHAIKRSNIYNKLSSKSNEHTTWASTFQQLPKCAPDEKKFAKNRMAEMKKPNLPAAGPRKNKPASKVSCLIKTFDKTENPCPEGSLVAVKLPVKNSSQKCKLIQGNDMAFWNDTALFNMQRELSQFSDVCRDNHWLRDKHEVQKRQNKIEMGYFGPHADHPALMDMSNVIKANLTSSSKKTAKNRCAKVKEPEKKGNFLHSENSAFESWNDHHNKLSEKEEFADIIPNKEAITRLEDVPLVKGSYTSAHKASHRKVTGPRIQENDFLTDQFPPTTEFRDYVPPGVLSQVPVPVIPGPPVPISPAAEFQIPIPAPTGHISGPTASLPQVSGLPSSPVYKAPSSPPPVSQVACTEKAATKPEPDYVCPPWRRQRNIKGATVKAQQSSNEKLPPSGEEFSFYQKPSAVEPLVDTTVEDKDGNAPNSISPSFNIKKLLTPVIPSKQERANQPVSEIAPLLELAAAKELKGSGFCEYPSRDNYKSKAPSLLFNLKDVRKRVKSTYSPSLLKGKNKMKENTKQGSINMNAMPCTFPEESSFDSVQRHELSSGPFVPTDTIQENQNTNEFKGYFTDNYLSLNSPQATVETAFYQSQDILQQDHSNSKDLLKDTEYHDNVSLSGYPSNEHGLRKSQRYPVLNSHSRDDAEATVVHHMPVYNSSIQGHENERDAKSQNGILPRLLPPANDDVLCNESEGHVRSSNENQGKTSNSSSEYSFVTTVDQPFQEDPFLLVQRFQKACLEESQRSRRNQNVDDKPRGKEKPEEKEEVRLYALSNGDTSTEERSKGNVALGESESVPEERCTSEKREEASSVNYATEDHKDAPIPKAEEATSPSSNPLKPSLFLIKDNTFKSSPVIKAIKLPLLRSLSLEETVSNSYREIESRREAPVQKVKLLYRQGRDAPSIQEIYRSLSRNTKEQDAREDGLIRNEDALASTPADMDFQGTDNTALTWEPTFSESVGSSSIRTLGEDEEVTSTLLNKVGKSDEERVPRSQEKPKVGKAKQYLARPKSALEDSSARRQLGLPSEERNYFKNHLLSNRRGGSCVKKIITRDVSSPAMSSLSESHAYCPVTTDVLGDIGHLEETPVMSDDLAGPPITNPRLESIVHSAVNTPLPEKTASSRATKTKEITSSAVLKVITKNKSDISAEEILDSTQRSLLAEDTSDSGPTNERSQSQMAKPLGKPPAVPPKSEKALRRAKRLASKRKKMEVQQKSLAMEQTDAAGRKSSQARQIPLTPVPCSHSPLPPVSRLPCPPSESNLVRLKDAPSVSPMPSSPAIQRKLLQDPDSGQYFIVDLAAQVRLKTFYEPETGKYIQVPVRSSEMGSHQPDSWGSVNPPCVLYPSELPTPVPTLRSTSQQSEPLSLIHNVPAMPAEDWPEEGRDFPSQESQPYIEPVSGTHSQHDDETQCTCQEDTSPATCMDIISMGDLEDFAVEGIS